MPSFSPPLGHCEHCDNHFVGQDADADDAKALKDRFANMPNRLPFTSQNPYVESLGEPDVYMLPFDAPTRNLTQVQQTLVEDFLFLFSKFSYLLH